MTANLYHTNDLDDILDVMRAFLDTSDIAFTFMTGITRFARTGLFSGVSHLPAIAFNVQYSLLSGLAKISIRCLPIREEPGYGMADAVGCPAVDCQSPDQDVPCHGAVTGGGKLALQRQ